METAAARAAMSAADTAASDTSAAGDTSGPSQPAASRLLSDIAAAAGDADTPPRTSSLSDRLSLLRHSPRPRYMRYSMLLDRDDLDQPRYRRFGDRRGTRGRDGPSRLRRSESFRESGEWSRRQELRERMLELRRLRDMNRYEGARRDINRGELSLNRGEVDYDGINSLVDRRDRSPFRHSSQSEFVPVTPTSLIQEPDRRRVLDIVGPPERSGESDEQALERADTAGTEILFYSLTRNL